VLVQGQVMTSDERLIGQDQRGALRILSLARPPLNALNRPLLNALSSALAEAEADPVVKAVVLAAEGPHFSAGIDARELGLVGDGPLQPLVVQIDAMTKPVVAALQGNALGGGLELALACHGRVAQEGARLGFPEIALGLLPVAGGTQRLVRLVGAPVALQILLEGRALTAVEALAMGLVDDVVEGAERAAVLARAEALAVQLAAQPLTPSLERRDGLRDPLAYQSAVTEARKRLAGTVLPAPLAVVDCVEAALLLPTEQGLAFEATQSEAMAESPEALALRHAFMAERRALALPTALAPNAASNRPQLARITLMGTGGPVPEVALQALCAGLAVRLVGPDRAALSAVLQHVAARQEAMVAEGRLNPSTREADWARLVAVLPNDAEAPADLVLVAPEAPRLSSLPRPALALGGLGPVVLHPGLEGGALATLAVAPDAAVDPQIGGADFARRLGWKLVVQGPGAAMDQRLRQALARAVTALEAEGQTRAQVQTALAAQGMVGLRPEIGTAERATARADAEAIVEFCMAALMAEGLRLVEAGVARRPSDIDAAAHLSRLMPRWQGGPMFQADQIGLMSLRADLRKRAQSHPELFTPPTIIDTLIGQGQRLSDLNRA
jgi:3-hydroxyacyl-CoA dehydrogenase